MGSAQEEWGKAAASAAVLRGAVAGAARIAGASIECQAGVKSVCLLTQRATLMTY